METIEKGGDTGDGPVEIAFAETREEGALIAGPLEEQGSHGFAECVSLTGPLLGTAS